MSAAQTRADYITACIRAGGSMTPEDAAAYLADHDAGRRAEILGDDLNPSSNQSGASYSSGRHAGGAFAVHPVRS